MLVSRIWLVAAIWLMVAVWAAAIWSRVARAHRSWRDQP